MAPRGRTTTAGEDAERSYDSSPDPLAISMNDNNASSRRRFIAKEPLTASSPSKQNERLETSEMIFSSPSKSMIMSTPRAGGASPWRIKVTVQAEPGSDEENTESPSVTRVTRTKTTTVPLKDHDAHTPAKRPRGRPRKSDAGTPAKPKRKGTPVKRAARSKSRDMNMRTGESSAADVDTDVPPKKKRGRPRKSVQLATEDDDTIVVEVPETRDDPTRDTTPARMETTTTAVSVSSKKSARFAHLSRPHTSPEGFEDLPAVSTPRQADLGAKLRARKGTPHAKKIVRVESDEDEEEGEGSDVLTPTSGEEEHEGHEASEDLAMSEDPRGDLLTPSEASAHSSDAEHFPPNAAGDIDIDAGAHDAQSFEDDEDEVQDVTHFAFDEGTTRMPDDTTVLDSENFSIISVDSLPSNGARSSPPKPEDTQASTAPSVGSLLRHEYLRPSPTSDRPAIPSPQGPTAVGPVAPVRPTLLRYKTPVVDTQVPSAPPALEPAQPAVPKSETPKLGRVVTAGVALQGLLDPSRITPEPSQKALDEKRERLDDLFRGFSEGTRRELQAGLRLGEQLAERQPDEEPTPPISSPIRGKSTAAPKESIFRTHRKYHQSRLLTPEDQDHVITPAESTTSVHHVQYPTLHLDEVENAPLSPARSENEMSWRVDTPSAAVTNTAREDKATETEQQEAVVDANKDEYSDIWQEEASRSSNSAESDDVPTEKSPQLQDLFTDNGPLKPARGKLPRTWRRKNADKLQYSDETESQQPVPAGVDPVGSNTDDDAGVEPEDAVTPPLEDQQMQTGEESSPGSEASDDTGLFFQSNMPNVFGKERQSRFQMRRQRQQETKKLSLSALLDQGESFLPDSSPPIATKNASPIKKTNPFMDTPPRFPALITSPKKSSPLRQELRDSDMSASSPRLEEHFEESTLPLAQSSPFRTIVDDSMVSAASDQQQFRVEMEGNTASSILRVREEANEYLDAYEQQERSLNEITEVTEPSRTWHQDRSLLPSSPPKMQQSFTQSMLSARTQSMLSASKPTLHTNALERSSEVAPTPRPAPAQPQDPASPENSAQEDTPSSSEASVQPVTSPQEQSGRLSRIKSALSRPSPPSPHPILSRLTPLPKIEPWTRTHYKSLDKLYATHLKHPTLFCPSTSPPTPLSTTNASLLRHFLSATNHLPYVGATFHAWGYSMCMTQELVVLCSVFTQLLRLDSVHEYEQIAGRPIQVGDCVPGRTGDAILGEEVLRRLATVVMGESVRRDERAGRQIDRSRGLEVEWPVRGR
ncbi:hypothetical protein BDW02DRAFT_639855 [Decorospora gaudefroyi]|uniref:AT DNA binding protein n=1 Tax=Decorospora gaudefroyi TaxID=184978 RepID=A0A6A5KBX4_9PLEO|nr:hypothetical protein BDW02DRAFT_639855 [Decorospora gaudefroyi]